MVGSNIKNNNILYSAGQGASGARGNGTTADDGYLGLVDISGDLLGETPTEIYAGWLDCAVVTASRKLFAWGGNASGQAGNGTSTQNNSPILVDLNIDL